MMLWASVSCSQDHDRNAEYKRDRDVEVIAKVWSVGSDPPFALPAATIDDQSLNGVRVSLSN